jgi:methyltransferase
VTPFLAIWLAVVAQRLLELVHARANTRRLLARGAVEVGAGHYPLFVLLHAGWLSSLAVLVPWSAPPHALPLIGLGVLMALRVWALATLGPYWTTRILTLPGAPLVRKGPYRWLRHPNYWVVAGEVALLPLAFDAAGVAIVFSALNGALLAYRISVEDRALAPRINARGSFPASA